MHLNDLVRSQETVTDALLERIGVDRCTKVVDVGNVSCFLRRGCQADLGRRSKIFQDFPPGGSLSRGGAVTLVDHDQIKKARGELAKDLLPLFWTCNGLIEPEVDFVGSVDTALSVDGRSEFGRAPVVALDGLATGA